MKKIIVCLPGNEPLQAAIANYCQIQIGHVDFHTFPDEETCVRLKFDCQDKDVYLLAQLGRPNSNIIPLLFLAQTCRDLGAKKVGLIAPYLPYMRQDARFQEGEGISAHYFAKILSQHFDWLITIDPHLHRILDLSQ